MLSESCRTDGFAGNRCSVELLFMEVPALCSDAGKIIMELRLGVSSSTSLEDVWFCWFPSSLDECGPCGATWLVLTELGVFWNRGSFELELWFWVYSRWFELELQLCEALNSSEFVLEPCRAEDCFNTRNWNSRYSVYVLWELLWSRWSSYWIWNDEFWFNPS